MRKRFFTAILEEVGLYEESKKVVMCARVSCDVPVVVGDARLVVILAVWGVRTGALRSVPRDGARLIGWRAYN